MANESAKFMKNCFIGWTNTTGVHYPHDYDPERVQKLNREEKMKLRKQGKLKKQMINMSMINPFTFVCDTCGQYNYTGLICFYDCSSLLCCSTACVCTGRNDRFLMKNCSVRACMENEEAVEFAASLCKHDTVKCQQVDGPQLLQAPWFLLML